MNGHDALKLKKPTPTTLMMTNLLTFSVYLSCLPFQA
jgi:hypothetical protein